MGNVLTLLWLSLLSVNFDLEQGAEAQFLTSCSSSCLGLLWWGIFWPKMIAAFPGQWLGTGVGHRLPMTPDQASAHPVTLCNTTTTHGPTFWPLSYSPYTLVLLGTPPYSLVLLGTPLYSLVLIPISILCNTTHHPWIQLLPSLVLIIITPVYSYVIRVFFCINADINCYIGLCV